MTLLAVCWPITVLATSIAQGQGPACRPHWVGQYAPTPAEAHAQRRTLELRNGRWYTNGKFIQGTRFIVDGIFRSKRPTRIDSVLDLAGGYVVPPFAEGHNHHLEPDSMSRYVARYLHDGVFYVQDMMSIPAMRHQFAPVVNRPSSIDLVSPNQGWTGPGGHPIEVLAQLRAAGMLKDTTLANPATGRSVIVVQTAGDVTKRWPLFLAGHPDFVKVFLVHSEDYAARLSDTSRTPAERGIDPALVPMIVHAAHAAGLCVAAHIETAADFRVALRAGVDAIGHLPGIGVRRGSDTTEFPANQLTTADAALARNRSVAVTTTVSWVRDGGLDSLLADRVIAEVMRPNIKLLRRTGVTILIGSDQFRQTSAAEARLLVAEHLFTSREALDSWSVITPRAIFPGRRIGRLSDGYEGSLLVLEGNPIDDFANTGRIRLRIKQGMVLQPTQ